MIAGVRQSRGEAVERAPAGSPSTTRRAPVRTCVGCRQRAPQSELLRVGLVGGQAVADPRRRLPGRGTYVHPVRACVGRASSQGSFARAFRARLVPPAVLQNAEGLVVDPRGSEEYRS